MSSKSLKNDTPGPHEVATRVVVLRHVVLHALISPPRRVIAALMNKCTPEESRRFRSEMESERKKHWESLGAFMSHMTPKEREFAAVTAVTMTDQQQVDALWRLESLQVLLWALGKKDDLPPYDTPADNELLRSFPSALNIGSFVSEASLRPHTILKRARDTAELWHWRSRTRDLIEARLPLRHDPKLKKLGIDSYDDIVRFTAERAHSEGTLPHVIKQDFAAKGKAYRDLDDDEWSETRSITIERHFALNWLCGLAPQNEWDKTPTDT